MHHKAAFFIIAVAVCLAPLAVSEEGQLMPLSAQLGLGDVPDVLAPLPGDVEQVVNQVLQEGSIIVGGSTGVSVTVGNSPASAPPSDDVEAAWTHEDRPASAVGKVAVAVAPAAGSALVAFLIGLLVYGLDSMRAVLSRFSGYSSRILRALGAMALVLYPMFSRIEAGRVMENPVRARVHSVLAQEPGLSLTEVGQRAGIAWGTTVHHLRRLETLGLVLSVRERSERRFFVANTPAARERQAMAVVMHPTARRIAEFVTKQPGVDQSGICKALGLNNPAASKHLRKFEANGLVFSQRSGRSRHYRPTSGLHSALALLEPAIGSAMAPGASRQRAVLKVPTS